MAGNLQLRARDVCRVCMVVLLWITGMSVHAQSIAARKVSCSFNATRLDEVIRHISLEAGVSFIYSSNKTDLNKVVTLRVESQSLEETLSLIGSQLGVEFKMLGRYVMIKQHTDAKPEQPLASGSVPFGRSSKARATPAVVAYYPASGSPPGNRLVVPAFVERLLPSFGPAFTSAEVTTIPVPEVRKISANNVHTGWFMSVGPVLNDYSSGIELQAGIRRAYLVITPSWMSSGRFHGGYGIGTSIDIGRNLSFTPIYSLGTSQHSSTTRWRNAQGINELREKEKTLHYMMKLMVQYAVTPTFVVRLGPTINKSYTTHDTFQTTTFTQRRTVITSGIGDGVSGSVVVVDKVNASDAAALLSERRVRNAWIGWEASVAFKLNFLGSR
ncbi:MAG TPA: STN domain-containing protein [Chryseolinea sp.]|nr:STN domain-containing protein [Chryseolinea sp.]